MPGLPRGARVGVLGAVLVALLCLTPVLRRPADVAWAVVLPCATLCALCEWLPRCPVLNSRLRPEDGPGPPSGWSCPLLLAAAFLLPPAAAALVPVPGALLGRVPAPATARRLWHAAELVVAVATAGTVYRLLSGDAAADNAPAVPDLPFALLPAMAAAVALCAVLATLDGAMLVLAERRRARGAWRGRLASTVPPHLTHALGGVMLAVLWRSDYGAPAAALVLLPIVASAQAFARYHWERSAHQATVRALVQAVDLKDRYTRGHGERVSRASVLIGRELGMDDSRLESLRCAGLLHDVGKLGVPTRVLRKNGPLTEEERRLVQLHPEYGHELVRGVRLLSEARAAILHHHERLDGKGYPHGLAGRHIPEAARVVAVADAFDAMTSTRSYRGARPVPAAMAELRRCAGTQFDPRMVRALAAALDRYGWSPAAAGRSPHPGGIPQASARPATDEVPGGTPALPGPRTAAHTRPGEPATAPARRSTPTGPKRR